MGVNLFHSFRLIKKNLGTYSEIGKVTLNSTWFKYYCLLV